MKRFTNEFSDFRGHYVLDNFLVKIVYEGSQSECRQKCNELNEEFHAKYKIVETKHGAVIRSL